MYLIIDGDNFGFDDKNGIPITDEDYNTFFKFQAEGRQFRIKNKEGNSLFDILEEYSTKSESELLEELKIKKITQTKEDLAKYLEENPLISRCKGGAEKKYTATLEKQNQLTATIADFLTNALPAILAGTPIEEIDIPLYWNAQGDICKVWTYSEIYQLKNEMMAYVRPIVEYQRYLEKTIMEQDTQDKIYELDCHFTRDKIDIFIASRNEASQKPGIEVVPDEETPKEPTDI